MSVRVGFVVDENDEPFIFRVRGYDQSNPEGIYTCRLEMWAGGRAVFRAFDPRPVTVSADPEMPQDIADAVDEQRVRGEEARRREAEARRDEIRRREEETQVGVEKQRIEQEFKRAEDERAAEKARIDAESEAKTTKKKTTA